MSVNVELFQRVKAKILEAPLAFGMGWYWGTDDESPCGTTQCIAGWAALLHKGIAPSEYRGVRKSQDQSDLVMEVCNPVPIGMLLGLGKNTIEYNKVFCSEEWFQPFKDKFVDALCSGDRSLQAQIAADYIDW